MFCKNCGKELPEGTKFCPQCGTNLAAAVPVTLTPEPVQAQGAAEPVQTQAPAEPAPAPQETVQPEQPARQTQPQQEQKSYQPAWYTQAQQAAQGGNTQQAQGGGAVPPVQNGAPAKNTKTLVIILAAAAAVIVLAIIILLFMLLHKPTINLNKYMTVTFEGYDTVGTATVTFDYDALEEDYGKKLNKTIKVKADSKEEQRLLEAFGEDTQEVDVYDFVYDCADYTLDVESGLSNGDEVTLTWEADDEEALETYGVKLSYEDQTYTVEGLEQAETFDPFADVEVTFEGTAPDGEAYYTVNSDDEAVWNYYYTFDQSTGLSNGDTVTLTVSMYYDDIVNYTIQNYGKIPSPLEKTFTVEGLPSYVSSVSEIPADQLTQMQQKAEEVFMNHVEDSWGEGERLDGFTYLGNMLLSIKEDYTSWSGIENRFYLVYRANVNDYYATDDEVYDQNVYEYWYFYYDNLTIDADGNFVYDAENYGSAETDYVKFTVDSGISYGWWSTMNWYYYGYQSYQELYQGIVTGNADGYNAEVNVDDSIADVVIEHEETETGDYLCADSDTRELTEEDIATYLAGDYTDYNFPGDRTIIQMIINEMYARHGYVFTDEELIEYFNQKEWYALMDYRNENMDEIYENMSDIEKANIELLEQYK